MTRRAGIPDPDTACGSVCAACHGAITWRDLAPCLDGRDRHLACMAPVPAAPPRRRPARDNAWPPAHEDARPRGRKQRINLDQGRLF